MGSESKQPAARLGDIGDKHGKYPPTPVIVGSGDVAINGRPAARKGDPLIPHVAPKSPPHPRFIKEGSGSVLINGKPAARVTDAVDCGGKIITGSGNVHIGDSPKLPNPITPPEWQEYMQTSMNLPAGHPANGSEREMKRLQADIAEKHRGAAGAVATWNQYYRGELDAGQPVPPAKSVADPAERAGLKSAQAAHAKEQAELAQWQNPTPAEPLPPYTPPTGFEDARARLKHSRERIAEDGRYTPRYTDAQLEQLADEPVTDSILVRVMEARYVDRGGPLQGTLGAPLAGTTGIKYWTTTFAHLEDSDLDPRLITKKMGLDYEPDAQYVVCLIDREKAEAFMGSQTFVPTYDNMQQFVGETLAKDFDPQLTAEVMNEGYQPVYECLHARAFAPGASVNIADAEEFADFAAANSMDEHAQEQFKERHKVHKRLGANEYFLGNALTLNKVVEPEKRYGNLETFTFDETPKTFEQMTEAGVVELIGPNELQPIKGVRA